MLSFRSDLYVAVLARQVQWSGALIVASVYVGTVTGEQRHQSCVPVQRCHMKRSEAVNTAAVYTQTIRLHTGCFLNTNHSILSHH